MTTGKIMIVDIYIVREHIARSLMGAGYNTSTFLPSHKRYFIEKKPDMVFIGKCVPKDIFRHYRNLGVPTCRYFASSGCTAGRPTIDATYGLPSCGYLKIGGGLPVDMAKSLIGSAEVSA